MNLPQRKRNRLKNYDYSQNGIYFVTICTKNKQHLFGTIVGDAALGVPQINVSHKTALGVPQTQSPNRKMQRSEYGEIVDEFIKNINRVYENAVYIDNYVVMPNHVHLIIVINNHMRGVVNQNGMGVVNNNGTPRAASPTVGRVINTLKSLVTKKIGFSVWQRSYHDHIIRNEREYQKIYEYIDNNPILWDGL